MRTQLRLRLESRLRWPSARTSIGFELLGGKCLKKTTEQLPDLFVEQCEVRKVIYGWAAGTEPHCSVRLPPGSTETMQAERCSVAVSPESIETPPQSTTPCSEQGSSKMRAFAGIGAVTAGFVWGEKHATGNSAINRLKRFCRRSRSFANLHGSL